MWKFTWGNKMLKCWVQAELVLSGRLALTINKWCEQHAEATESALLVGPHSYDSHVVVKHHIVSHGAAELGLEVFNGTAAIVHSHEVLLTLIGMLHLVVYEAQVDLGMHRRCKSNEIHSDTSLRFTAVEPWQQTNFTFYVSKVWKIFIKSENPI